MVLRSAMSSGSRRGCSKALATYPPLPCWKSLIKESIGRGDLFNTKGGFQAWTLVRRSCPLSTTDPSLEDLVWAVLATLAPFCDSTSLAGRPFPSSTTFLPFWSHFLFLSVGSIWEAWDGGGVGGLAWMATSGAFPLHGTPRDPKGLF